mgnify:FL=1
MNEKLLKYKPILQAWKESGSNYGLSVDWVELNILATELGNQAFNLGCSDCRRQLANFIHDSIKEMGI